MNAMKPQNIDGLNLPSNFKGNINKQNKDSLEY